MQQHVQNKKLKRQSQMLLDRLNAVNKPIGDVLPELVDIPESSADDGSDSQLDALTNKINSLFI